MNPTQVAESEEKVTEEGETTPKKQLPYKEPTRKQWDDEVDRAASQAIRELDGACFVCDALYDLFLPATPWSARERLIAEYGEDWEEQYDAMAEQVRRSDAPVHLDFKIDMALAVVKKLREQKKTGKSTPAPRRRRHRRQRRNRTY